MRIVEHLFLCRISRVSFEKEFVSNYKVDIDRLYNLFSLYLMPEKSSRRIRNSRSVEIW